MSKQPDPPTPDTGTPAADAPAKQAQAADAPAKQAQATASVKPAAEATRPTAKVRPVPKGESAEVRRARLQDKIAQLPTAPGCYLMRDAKGRVFYVGKASNLRARVRSYFSGTDTRQFVAWLDQILVDLDTVVVLTETDALLLERTLIRDLSPRFNVLLKDDKNFIHLRLDTRKAVIGPNAGGRLRKRYPRLEVVRNPRSDGARYFGPYTSASAVRQTLRLINKHFGLRTCRDAVLENRKRPCLQAQIGRCSAPCVEDVADYHAAVSEVSLLLGGKGDVLKDQLKARMWDAAQNQQYEVAARVRDQLSAVESAFETNTVSEVGRRKDQDVFAAVRKGPLLQIGRLVIRGGGLLRSETFAFKDQQFPTAVLLESFASQLYADMPLDNLPDEVLFDRAVSDELLSLARTLGGRRKKRIKFYEPARGHGKRLLAMAEKNAEEALAERMRKQSLESEALTRVQAMLGLEAPPRVIECYDVSLFQGSEPVASGICFVDGAPDSARYRLYNIKTVDGTDDFAMLYEALSRRLKRGVAAAEAAARGDDAQAKWLLPDLMVIDGGKGQLGVAQAACRDHGVRVGPKGMGLCSLAKARDLQDGDKGFFGQTTVDADGAEGFAERAHSPERVFMPGAKDPHALRPHTPERFLFERMRDEAHRFAITAHRKRRKKRTLKSALDDIAGVGPGRRRALLKHFGSLKRVKAATAAELAEAPGIGPALAAHIAAVLRGEGPPAAPEPAGTTGTKAAGTEAGGSTRAAMPTNAGPGTALGAAAADVTTAAADDELDALFGAAGEAASEAL